MAIPVHLQQFKAAGIYRVVFDKSTIVNVDSEIIRLVVGYSEVGPFNIPVYVRSTAEFKAIFGNASKKLEKRGIHFHSMALQALQGGPILCLNLKKFDGETVSGSTISTEFNTKFNPIDTVKLNVEDIYDTTRFWELNANKLNDLRAVSGSTLDQYINLAITNTKASSCSYFIRKASGSKVAGYDLTVNTWYSDGVDEMPEFLENHRQNKISDYFAEIYVFKGKFTAKQVLASETLKNYFVITNEKDDVTGEPILKLRDKIYDAYGEPIDTLDALYFDEASGAIGHYVGSLIPYFKNKQGGYAALDIVFNNDIDNHNMMMSFNTDLIDEEITSIDLSGRLSICDEHSESTVHDGRHLFIKDIYEGTAKTTLLGNVDAPVIAEQVDFQTNIYDTIDKKPYLPFNTSNNKIGGTLFVVKDDDAVDQLVLKQVGSDDTVTIKCDDIDLLKKTLDYENTAYAENAFLDESDLLAGPKKVITGLSRIAKDDKGNYLDKEADMKVSFKDVETTTINKLLSVEDSVYAPSVSFVSVGNNWQYFESIKINGVEQRAYITYKEYDNTLLSVIKEGDCLLAANGQNADDADDEFSDNIYASTSGTEYEDGKFKFHYILVSGEPKLYNDAFIIRLDNSINQEIGTMQPTYFEGYTYKNSKPKGTDMLSKYKWQEFILSTLSEYKGLRDALLNRSEVDYRYVVDTFESYPVSNLKSRLAYLCKQKQSAFLIANFPSVQTFIKCPYTSFTDNKGIFNVKYVVEGGNKKKMSAIKFTLPTEGDGASYAAFYTPLKFSDGYIDTVIPSAALVSNLFIQKYMSRQPYYIVAGPNYGNIYAAGMVGPDYKYTMDELQVIEPFGVNCMVYRPNFGTFINANQTAKQTPLSALSKVNVRELVIFLQDEIEKVLQAHQWEFNNVSTRSSILNRANSICEMIKMNGGIQAYVNVMDETNNTPEIIDNEMAVLSTYIEPGMGCGKMVHELTIYRTGQLTSNIKD